LHPNLNNASINASFIEITRLKEKQERKSHFVGRGRNELLVYLGGPNCVIAICILPRSLLALEDGHEWPFQVEEHHPRIIEDGQVGMDGWMMVRIGQEEAGYTDCWLLQPNLDPPSPSPSFLYERSSLETSPYTKLLQALHEDGFKETGLLRGLTHYGTGCGERTIVD